jgi:hypothetical protein
MSHCHQPYTFLLIAKSDKDAQKLDAAIREGKLDLQKAGSKSYLGFFFETPKTVYFQLRENFGIQDEIHWIQLPYAEVTK